MPRSPFAEYVPLPDVGEHSDRITIGQLGLPVGFDESALLLNVKGIERAATVAGLSRIAITGGEGAHDQESFSISGIGSDGSIAAGGLRKVRQAPLYTDTPSPISRNAINRYYRPKELRLNMSGVEAKIQADGRRWQRGLLDPGARAHYMNKGLQDAVWRAGIESHTLLRRDTRSSALSFGGAFGLGELINANLPGDVTGLTALGFAIALFHAIDKAGDIGDQRNASSELPRRIVYAVPSVPIERLPLTAVVAYSTRMIRVA